MPKVTISDIAQAAGVSTATVSMALSGKGKISEAVIAKIKSTANNLGYSKSPRKPLTSPVKEKNVIGFLCEIDPEWDFAWRFIRPIITNIESQLRENDFHLVLIPIHLDLQLDEIMERVISSGVHALFSMHYGNLELFKQLENLDIPIVVINNGNFQNILYSVCTDNFHGCYEGTQYLIEKGHTVIGYIDYERPDMPRLINDRYMGYRSALENHNLHLYPDVRLTTQMNNMKDLHYSLNLLLSKHSAISALVCHDDYLAGNVIATLNQLGKNVPEDISIIAPGDVLNHNDPHIPPITTMRINIELMGKTAAEMMISRMKNTQEGLSVLKVNQELVERGSVRALN